MSQHPLTENTRRGQLTLDGVVFGLQCGVWTIRSRVSADELLVVPLYERAKPILETVPELDLAIVGPSGAGKSSVFRLLLGLEAPESGSAHFYGKDLATLDVQAVRH